MEGAAAEEVPEEEDDCGHQIPPVEGSEDHRQKMVEIAGGDFEYCEEHLDCGLDAGD